MMTVACIGAGTVGRAWGVVFARAGQEVRLYDSMPGEAAGRARDGARRTLELFAENGLLDEPVETVLARIVPAQSIADAVSGAAYVQESVREDLQIKREVFAEISAFAHPNAILASSTSALPGSEFMGEVANPERALVVHPVNPPSLIPLVELCGTRWTSPDTVVKAKSFMIEVGMKPIVLKKEIDGFILNRLQFTLVAEALHLVGEGYCDPEDIDAVLTDGLALRWASIGPFEVAHLNAPDGMQGFIDRLGPMMRHMGREARTDYDWTDEQVARTHARLCEHIPLDSIAARQAWRDGRILALRRMKRDVPDPLS
ncbi:MAG TPA: 3-hydroxyacyl-CoA dehydrogenase [Ensifer sp.]|nr:3-hydroxyacyl-CoA dehydrogenase [Ensifer sp.]